VKAFAWTPLGRRLAVCALLSAFAGNAHAACVGDPHLGVAFVLFPSTDVEKLSSDSVLDGKSFCVVVTPGPATRPAYLQKMDAPNEWFLDVELESTNRVRKIFSQSWQTAIARIELKSDAESIHIRQSTKCVKKFSVKLQPTQLLRIEVAGLAEPYRSRVRFRSFKADYIVDRQQPLRCDVDPSADVVSAGPVLYKFAAGAHVAPDDVIDIEIDLPGTPERFRVPIRRLLEQDSLRLLDYVAPRTESQTGILRAYTADTALESSALRNALVVRQIENW